MFLHQSEFIDQILSRFGMEKCNPKRTPMESKLQIQSEENKLSTEFRSLIGALLFVACNTCPDVSYAVNYWSRFQSKFSDQVMSYGMRILQYLAGTRKYGINYENSSNEPVEAYVDASFIDRESAELQSTGGFAVFVFGNLIDWRVRKQQKTVSSTAAAEYVAMNDCIKNITFIRYLNITLMGRESKAIVYNDNSSAISFRNGLESDESRYLRSRYYKIWQKVRDGEVNVVKIPGSDQLADIFTKLLDFPLFAKFREKLVQNDITC
jgi:hypothetical protein